jgi:hypothetical protein
MSLALFQEQPIGVRMTSGEGVAFKLNEYRTRKCAKIQSFYY